MHNAGRKSVLVLLVLSILILFGLGSFMGILPTTDLGGGLKVFHLIAGALIVVTFMIWKNKMS